MHSDALNVILLEIGIFRCNFPPLSTPNLKLMAQVVICDFSQKNERVWKMCSAISSQQSSSVAANGMND